MWVKGDKNSLVIYVNNPEIEDDTDRGLKQTDIYLHQLGPGQVRVTCNRYQMTYPV